MKQEDFDDSGKLVDSLTEKRMVEFDLHRGDLRLPLKFEPRGIEKVIPSPNPHDTPEAVTTAPPG